MNQRGVWQLILMAREGDRQAIDELFYSSFRPAYLILYAITADKRSSLDILAEGYVDVFQNIESLETAGDFSESLNRYVIGRAKALFPSNDFLRFADGCEAEAFGFRQNQPQIHDFDTLPAIKLAPRADEILGAFHAMPLEQQISAYLFYYVQMPPDVIANILETHENKICGTLQQTRNAVLPQIESVLRKNPAFRGVDAESAIPWALRCTEQFAPQPTEVDACRQTVIDKLISDEILDVSAQEEVEAEPEFEMQNIAPPKEHHVLRAIFSLPTLIGVLVVLIAVGAVIGFRQLHEYNERRHNLDNQTDRTTLALTSTTYQPDRTIFYTELEAPTEPETTLPPETEPTDTTAPSTEAPVTVTEPTSPVITTAPPYADFDFIESASAVTITGYKGSKTTVDVPADINGKRVTEIGERAFRGTGITSITLPTGIHSIGKDAFNSCSSLQRITLPSTVTTIGDNAFRGCAGLSSVTLPSSLTSIGAYAFYQCSSLSNIALPSSLTSIGDWAFAYSSLQRITIPAAVKTVGTSVFYECKFLAGCLIENNSHLSALGSSMFFNCTSLTSFSIPSNIKKIPVNCFMKCLSLASISVPSSVTTIEQNAFAECISLSDVTLRANLKTIENGAFSGCKGLKDVVIPNGVTSIGDNAFSECTSLRSISIPASVTKIGTKAFHHCEDLVITCPAGSAAEKYADNNHIEVAGRTTATSTTYTSDSSSE